MKGILINRDDDLQINVKRDVSGKIINGLVVGERLLQDAYIVLKTNMGDIKEDPIAGANLLRMLRSKASREKIRKTIEIALARVNIRYEDIKQQIEVILNKTT
jgi:hypothetical protein